MSVSPKGLRNRKLPSAPQNASTSPTASDSEQESPRSPVARDDVVWGKTPGGEVFHVPSTHDVLTLFHPAYPKSHFDLLNLSLLGLQLVLFFSLSRFAAQVFFFLYFVFWRAAYDAGLGWVLTRQSKKKWMVKEVQRRGWLDEKRRPEARQWIRAQLVGKMGQDYSFDELPMEYNTWLLFRQLVDVILLNDFLAYCMFAFACFRIPEDLSIAVHILRWLGGILLIAFNLWVKTEAHNVVKDYGWYWGDVFFQRGGLVFDGVFNLAPHPMYSVGYAGYYGLSLIVGSYSVLFVSLAAHAAQFAFLILFENPHIERMYGQRKPIAVRRAVTARKSRSPQAATPPLATLSEDEAIDQLSTPPATEGETATESDLETEAETETEGEGEGTPKLKATKRLSPQLTGRLSPISSVSVEHAVTQHDLLTKYFRRDTVILQNIDLLRSSDAMLVLVVLYVLTVAFVPALSYETVTLLHFVHACCWCLFHSFGLGALLRAQSNSKFFIRHFMKHYHYPSGDRGQGAVQEAFTNWKGLYNLSLCMTYTSLIGLAWKTYSWPMSWTVGDELLCHTLGALLIGLHVWAAIESYEVLGVFGWFYGDFFMEDFPAHLEYTGIFRYLNNPELMSGASFLGLALMSGSKLVGALAVIRFLSNWWFLTVVENPHMRKLYGDSLRNEAGFVKVIKNVASKNARLLESRAGRHGPEIRRVARQVQGTFDKVYEETADVVEEFLAKSKPRISEVMQETKVLLQQSRERLVITRVANDLSSCDTAKYKIGIAPSKSGDKRFHLGEPITVTWEVPQQHSRRDWVGIYRVGANKSILVTKTSSLGMWVPVHDEEWDGDIFVGASARGLSTQGVESQAGTVTFRSSTLPWNVGRYEIRYHHDGKYNVLGLDGPFEVYVNKPDNLDFDSVRNSLTEIVPLCLDSDPSLIPLSCGGEPSPVGEADAVRGPDDFNFWNERQAKRISSAIRQAFDIEYAPEVVMADANLTSLANRILVSKRLASDA
ncbi:hypothetical protein CONPUDRAFT_139346 [Coniophora puteana RWD-64-598 SS2]|uniref:Phosphatidylethanolamine N-methyltransferase n=1 Tax=Coniophora puteana (strain RWD-64-598) TaxID=741705 RepID=A0A5M3MD57_CONPW|nr:uncharacterized protein CONPUDRAFT_139346 [Coniophora puteana RWD-64-598 SS2]EIW76565.1 hypothetical protein CONPUDRAFT_139346 [Coniophora puteana RWD-64-598 SS2]